MFNIQPNHNNQKPKTMFKTQPITSSINIAAQIFYTTDYTVFKELLGNRDVDENHVKRLIKSMKEEYLEIPIQVNQKMQVIDGQHRLAACKELGLPVFYMIMKSAGLDQTQRQNALSKKWAITDVLESFCKRGFSNYIVVKSFMEDFGFTLYQSLTILTLNQLSTEQTINFKSGNFEIKDLNRSKIAAKNLLKLKDVVSLNDTIIFRAFFHLVTKCEEFDVNYFIQKMQYQSQKFKKQRDRALQIENIEEIYNYRNQNKVNLRIIK